MAYDGCLRVPGYDAEDRELLDFKDRWFSDYNVYRSRKMEQYAMNHYYYLGRQWIELDTEVLLEGSRGFVFRDKAGVAGDHQYPTPVTNKISPSVEVELSALTKRQLIPNVLPTSRDPRVESAAKVGKQVLEHRLRKLKWPNIRSRATLNFILYGIAVMKSYWDAPWGTTVKIGSVEAVGCPDCGFRLSTPMVPKDQAQGMVQDAAAEVGEEVLATNCPNCGTPLQPVQAGPEMLEAPDALNRPMYNEVPKGDTALEVVSPFDLFPENSGVDVEPDDCRVWGQATIRHLDWIEERYPGKGIEPDDPTELLKYHPILGDWDILGRYHNDLDSNIYDCHVRLYEVTSEKSYRFPQGWRCAIANDKVVYRGPLYVQLGDNSVPMVSYSAARWKVRPQEFWGKGLVEDLISPQNRLNGMDSQIIEARERMGMPNLLTSKAMYLEGPDWDQRWGGAILTYETDPLNPNAKPEVFGNELMESSVYQERDRITSDMKELSGPQDIEIGAAPKNITTTSGLQLLGEASERRRSERERSLTSMFEVAWMHQLELLGTLRIDQDSYETKSEDGGWEVKYFDRESLAGQTKVFIEKQAEVDKSLYQREATREAQADGLYRLDSPAAVRRILELRGLPTDVNENTNHQLDGSKKQWLDFVDEGIIPTIDPTLDDFSIHFEVLGTFLISQEGARIQEAVGWRQVLPKIAGWEMELAQMEQQDLVTRQMYGPDPVQAQDRYAQAFLAYGKARRAEEQAQQAAAKVPGAVPAPSVLQPPPQPFYLPPDKAERVYQLWMQKIQQHDLRHPQMTAQQFPPGDGSTMTSLMEQHAARDQFIRFRSVVDAYRLLAQEKLTKSMMGLPPAPTPGGPANPMGGSGDLNMTQPANPPNPNNPPNVATG